MTDSPAALAYSYGLSDAHFSSLSQLQSQRGGTELGAEPYPELALPYLPQIHGLLSFPVSQVMHCSIPLLIISWPRGVPQRTGLDFSARVDHSALFDKRKGVSTFWQHLCTEDAVSVAVPAHITAPFCSQSAAEDFPCFPHRVAIVVLSWCPKHLEFSSCLPSVRHYSAFLPQKCV